MGNVRTQVTYCITTRRADGYIQSMYVAGRVSYMNYHLRGVCFPVSFRRRTIDDDGGQDHSARGQRCATNWSRSARSKGRTRRWSKRARAAWRTTVDDKNEKTTPASPHSLGTSFFFFILIIFLVSQYTVRHHHPPNHHQSCPHQVVRSWPHLLQVVGVH